MFVFGLRIPVLTMILVVAVPIAFPPPQWADLVLFSLHVMFIVRLRVPVLTMILAATAVPIALRPPQWADLHLFSIDPYDILANIAGFVPVGIVLAALGPVWAVMAAALLSMFAETSQLVMVYRSPSLTDVATNVLGAILGVIVAARYNIKPEFKATRRIGTVAAVLALLLILGVWTISGDWAGDRSQQLPEPEP